MITTAGTDSETMDHNVECYLKLLNSLLAPTWEERNAADNLLQSVLISQDTNFDGKGNDAIGLAITKLGQQRDVFFSALIGFWADISAQQYSKRMADFDTEEITKDPIDSSLWQSPHMALYPMDEEPNLEPFDFYGYGISMLLENMGPVGSDIVIQLSHCLQHPEPVVQDTVFSALGSMGVAARPVLPALLKEIRRKGCWCQPFRPGMATAAVIGDDIEAIEQIVHKIDPNGHRDQIHGPCGLLRLVQKVSPYVVDCLLQKCTSTQNSNDLFTMATTGAQLANKINHSMDKYLDIAKGFVRSTDPDCRCAAAKILGYVGSAANDGGDMLLLVKDKDWEVRTCAHDAAACWSDASNELILAVAQDVGNFDGYDEAPHYDALSALIQWGQRSDIAEVVVTEKLLQLTNEQGYDSSYINQVADLAEALGPKLNELKKVIRKIMDDLDESNNYDEEDYYDDDDNESFDDWSEETEASTDIVKLVHKIGFPVEGDIPGTISLKDEDDDPIENRLKSLLEG